MKASLTLEDGLSFSGRALGAGGERLGQVILNTAVVGYQEMVTDPANSGKIIVMTYPLAGNYGVAPKFNQSENVWAEALVAKENSRIYSNWQAKESLEEFAKREGLLMLTDIDTRTLAVHLRSKGEMPGVISTGEPADKKTLLAKISSWKAAAKSLLPKISVSAPKPVSKGKMKISLLDLGVTGGLIAQLEALGLAAQAFPYNTPAKEILKYKSRGLIISGGPEEDSGLAQVAENVKGLLGKIPILGISTGHQVLAAALGGKLKRLKLGHRGGNYPMYHPASYQASITVQNHGWCVDADSLARIKEIKITGYNLNDRSVEEMESKKLKILGAQYLPASPGLGQAHPVFTRFLKNIRGK